MDAKEAQGRYEAASALYRENRYEDALFLLNELNVLYPGNKDIGLARARCLGKLGRSKEAAALCDALIARFSDPRAVALKHTLSDATPGELPAAAATMPSPSGVSGAAAGQPVFHAESPRHFRKANLIGLATLLSIVFAIGAVVLLRSQHAEPADSPLASGQGTSAVPAAQASSRFTTGGSALQGEREAEIVAVPNVGHPDAKSSTLRPSEMLVQLEKEAHLEPWFVYEARETIKRWERDSKTGKTDKPVRLFQQYSTVTSAMLRKLFGQPSRETREQLSGLYDTVTGKLIEGPSLWYGSFGFAFLGFTLENSSLYMLMYRRPEPGATGEPKPTKHPDTENNPSPPPTANRPKSGQVLPPYTVGLFGDNELRIRNPNDFSVKAGVRAGNKGKDLDVPPNSVRSVSIPDGHYNIYFVYSTKPDALFQGDSFTLNGNGVEIQIVKVVNGNYNIRQVK